MPVLIDHFTFLFVNAYPLFIVNVGLALVNLIKQTYTAFADLRGSRVRYFMRRHPLVFLDFHDKQGRRRSRTCSQNLTKGKKINQTSRHARTGH